MKTARQEIKIVVKRKRRMLDKIFIGLILLTPLIILRDGGLREAGRVYWVWGVVEAWGLARIIAGRWRIGKAGGGLIALAVVFGVWGAEAMLAGGNAIWGGWWRRQGWVTLAHIGVLMALVGTAAGPGDGWQKDLVKWVKATAILAVATGFILGGEIRWAGTLGEANAWGMVAMVLGIVGGRWVILGLPAIVLTQSRAALLALTAGLGWGKLKMGRKAAAILAVVILMGVGWASWWRGGGGRITLWAESYKLWEVRPWFGWGMDNFGRVFTQAMQGKGLEWQRYDQPHNLALWLLVSTGSVGAACFTAMTDTVVRGAWRGVWGRMIVGLLVYGLFQPWSIMAWVYWAVAMGAILAGKNAGGKELEIGQTWVKGAVGGVMAWWWLAMAWPTFRAYF